MQSSKLTATTILALVLALGAATFASAQTAEREVLALTYPENETISVKFLGTERLPEASGEAKVERKKGMTEIEVELDEMKPATLFGGDYTTFVLWVVSPEGKVDNLGELILQGNRSKLNVSTPLETFGMFITAEPHFLVPLPSRFVVMENTEPTVHRPIRVGRLDYRGFPGQYVFEHESLEHFPETKGEVRAHVASAESAVALAERADAERFAADRLELARDALTRAQRAAEEGADARTLMILSHEAIRRAVEARELAEERSYEAALTAERRARQTEIEELETNLRDASSEAERARIRAEKNEMQAQMEAEARREAQARAEEAFRQARAAQEEAREALEAKVEADKERIAAERARSEAEQEAFDARREREEARAELREALAKVIDVQATARGLIVSLPDILFEFDSARLSQKGREALAKVAGVLMVADDYELKVEGHTDDVGSEAYNRKLSLDRADSVRDYLVEQNVPAAQLSVEGFGESRPIASNDTSSGRRENRRVEIVIEDAPVAATGRLHR